MHATTTTATRTPRRLVFLMLLAVLLLLALAAPAFAAKRPDFTGGPGATDYPMFVPNDGTVCAMRFTATGGTLQDAAGAAVTTAGVQYNVKIRVSPLAAPDGTNNRGFTWNQASQKWIQEREDWANFPVATTVAGGAISGGTNWYYFKFGDTTKSGPYYIIVSLQPVGGGSGTTQNASVVPAVTVMDMSGTIAGAQSGFWVHNFGPTGFAGRRVEADAATAVWALSRSVGSTGSSPVPPDGTAGADGDFVLGTPTGSPFDVLIQTTTWTVSGSLADVNIALGGGESTPPSAPGAPSVVSGDTTAALSWGAATDDTGVTGYTVYRWVDPPTGAGYTADPVAVHTATGAETSWTDTGLTNGTTYRYFVRAYDAATNVGPRSATVDAAPIGVTALTFGATVTTVAWGKPWSLSGALSTAAGAAVPDAPVKLMQSVGSGAWTLVSTLTPAAGTSTYTGSIAAPTQKTTYKLVYEGTAAYAGVFSRSVTVTPKVKLGHPVAPSTVKKKKSFTVYGSLTPKANAGSKTVKIKCYAKKSGKWVLKKTVTAKNANKGSASQYKASTSLPSKGSWKLVATAAATSKYAATTSSPEYLKVK